MRSLAPLLFTAALMNARTEATSLLAAHTLKTLVISFNAPELNYLAGHLAHCEALTGFVRPYVNKGRPWERIIERLPLAGSVYARTFGRRRIDDPQLLALTREAAVLPDFCAALLLRAPTWLDALSRPGTQFLDESVRKAVARRGAALASEANCVVAFHGFARDAFKVCQRNGGHAVLNYPIAHHKTHRKMWAEEVEREPAFASTWVGFDHWPEGFEAQLDEEIALADGILVGSSYARDSFIDALVPVRKIHSIAYGVDLDVFSPSGIERDRNGFDVIYAGQLSQRKGLSYLLRGYRKFQRRDTRLTLVGALIGNGAPLVPYRDVFRHVPHLPRPALAQMYRQSSVFVFPTLIEGMGLVVLEAMACGLPVIVTGHGPGDLVRDGIDGFVIPIRNEDAIAQKLELLYDDAELCRQMGQNARARALQYHWDVYAQKVTRCLLALGDA